MSSGAIAAIVVGGILLVVLVVLFVLLPKKAYFTALFSGAYISFFKLIGMKFRKLDVAELVDSFVLAKKSHVGVTLKDMEIVLTGGGHPMSVAKALICAKSANLGLDFSFIRAVDAAGRDALEVVRECISPKVVELPLVTAVTQDGFELNAKISLTMKVNLDKFLSGVTEETLIARATEAAVTKIANTKKASELTANPQILDKAIFEASTDEGCKYTLVSADVIHLDVGQNRGFVRERELLEKDRIIKANQMEHRRLAALAEEQEMKAKEQKLKLKIVENEAEVPKAVVKAIEEGKIQNVVDYYKLQNLQADTEMRRHLIGKRDDDED